MRAEEIHRILVVGAGTMGQQIGLQCAMYGYDVTLYDITNAALVAATEQVRAYATHLVTWGRRTQKEGDAALARIRTTADPAEAADGADLLSESVPEDEVLKGRVLAQFNELCPQRTVFTTNTSTLLPSMFAEATGRPSQFAALHFHQHVWEANVVDIMPHPGTSRETVELLRVFAERIGQTPIVLNKENSGYVFNAMLRSWNRAAVALLVNGVASVEDIDRAWTGVTKMFVGPFGMLDAIGLDLAWHTMERDAKAGGDPQLQANAALLKQYVDKGWLGLKSGRGFYKYT